MTRKDFEFFVQWLAENRIHMNATYSLLDYFKQKNPRFDANIFADALLKAFNKRDGLLKDE